METLKQTTACCNSCEHADALLNRTICAKDKDNPVLLPSSSLVCSDYEPANPDDMPTFKEELAMLLARHKAELCYGDGSDD